MASKTPADTLTFPKLRMRGPKQPPSQSCSTHSIIGANCFSEPLTVIEETREPSDISPEDIGQFLPSQEPCNSNLENRCLSRQGQIDQTVIDKHYDGQFDWILSTPFDLNDQKCHGRSDSVVSLRWRQYGCNLLTHHQDPGSINYCELLGTVYTLLATELRGDDDRQYSSGIADLSSDMAASEPIVRVISPSVAGNVDGEAIDIFIPEASPAASDVTSTSGNLYQEANTPPRTMAVATQVSTTTIASNHTPSGFPCANGSKGRIEDSVEALDKLEDHLEAMQAAAQIRGLASPGKGHRSLIVGGEMTTHGTKVDRKSATVRAKSTSRPSLRRSASLNLTDKKPTGTGPPVGAASGARKPVVTRPSSLLPPKAPTKSSFELPGEAVARRLKEQREARRSLQISAENAPFSVPLRAKTVKAPTVPKFELPGEAISERKKEQREKQLREQAEEERKRREFKAAPVRSTLVPPPYRETAASRARRVKVANEESQRHVGPSSDSTPMPSKRISVTSLVSRPSLRKSASTISNVSTASTSSQSRGRVAGKDESETSRGTSTSVGSAGAKRNTVSIEEVERQRLRGKEIYDQDNSYAIIKEGERRQRELAAKFAREQAAERSRQASREWAERQRRRQSAIIGVSTVS